MSQANAKQPLSPYLVLLVAILLPGMGQVLNNAISRALMMIFFMILMGVVTYNVALPGVSIVGKFAGGIFIYMVSVMDAYYWAKVREEVFKYR